MKVFVKESSYDPRRIHADFAALMDGMEGRRIEKGMRVLIKPNLLRSASPDEAITTHHSLVKAAVEYVLDRGGLPQVSDSPAIGSFERLLAKNGLANALMNLEVKISEFRETRPVDIGPPYGKIALATDALDADMIINLPKLKTHTQMLLTLGVKNMFGAVVGFTKPQWHLKCGARREVFARLLVRIYERLKPSFTVLDGIKALHGDGPGRGGRPLDCGIIMGSVCAHSLDTVVCRLLRIDPLRLPTHQAARELGFLDGMAELEGSHPPLPRFSLPSLTPVIFGPSLLQNFTRQHLLTYPVCNVALCSRCGECQRICPAGAISTRNGEIRFDLRPCIRCHCCLEICPDGAVRFQEPLAGRFTRRFLRL